MRANSKSASAANKVWARNVFLWTLLLAAQSVLAGPPLQIRTTGGPGDTKVTLELPRELNLSSLLVKLNGIDVSQRFHEAKCGAVNCLAADLSAADGLAAGKNVIAAVAGDAQKNVVSARARFETTTSADASASPTTQSGRSVGTVAADISSGSVSSPFLPPTVTLKTLNDGGYNRTGPWIQLGAQQYPASLPDSCSISSIYTVLVFDRRTLVPKTSAPENSPQCFGSAGDLKAYLGRLPSGDLVIAGTNFNKNADKGLDTSVIGGQAWNGNVGTTALPAGYIIIGAVGAAAQSAYQGYYVLGGSTSSATPFATGMLQEDVSGNYNFQSTDLAEYFVVPNAPLNQFHFGAPTSDVTIETPPSARGNYRFSSYIPPITSDNQYQDGYWVLAIDRKTLEPRSGYGCSGGISFSGNTQYYSNCGRFYRTGSGTHASESTSEYQRLMNDLNALYQDPWTLVFLVSVRQASCCDTQNAVRGAGSVPSPYLNGFDYLAIALYKFGGTPYATVYPLGYSSSNYTPVYSLVTAAGLGNSMSGTSVESSNAFSQQGQTGILHGTLGRNLNGLFTPEQTSQETYDTLIAKGGTNTEDFVLPKVAALAPVSWPIVAGKLSGADSLSGQIDAYRFISMQLLRTSYIKGIAGPHQDDLHYFFNGSSNTFIDYHTIDPIDLPLPTVAPAQANPGAVYCTSIVPGPDGNDTCNANLGAGYGNVSFSMNDFTAARVQTSAEVIYLTNALNFLVTGSTNIKSVIAGGNSSVGLALTGAAATILGSKLVPVAPTTTVSVSWQNVVAMVGGVTSLGSLIPGIGGIIGTASKAQMIFGTTSNAVSGIMTATSAAGGIVSSTTSNSLPSSFSSFAMTIGDLANGSMQGQLATSFDAVVDDITSDWGRLSAIGPRTVDTSNPVFFSANQSAENVAVSAITQGASRSFYITLMPIFYQVHFWPRVHAYWEDKNRVTRAPTPDMGYLTPNNSCYVFYLPHSSYTLQPGQGTWVYTSGLEFVRTDNNQFKYDFGGATWYLIAGTTSRAGQSDAATQLIDPALASRLFSSDGLNLPILQFTNKAGPMQSVWVDASVTMPQRLPYSKICAGSDHGLYPSSLQAVDATPLEIDPPSWEPGIATPAPGLEETVTTLNAPASVLSGENLVLVATVLAGGVAVNGGQVSFRYDGNQMGLVNVDSSGSASFTITDPAVGAHQVFASYALVAPYNTSESAVSTVEVSVPAEDMTVTASANSMTLHRGSTSAPVAIIATSQLGLAGMANFQCTGLPPGVSCVFSPSQVALPQDGTATASLIVTSTQDASAVLILLLLLPAGLGSRWGRRIALIVCITAGGVAISSCGGGGSGGDTDQPPQVVSFVVDVTVGSVTRSTPITVTLD